MLVDSSEALETLLTGCRPQEQRLRPIGFRCRAVRYTFLMEALVNPMPPEVMTEAIGRLKGAILGIKSEKRYMRLASLSSSSSDVGQKLLISFIEWPNDL